MLGGSMDFDLRLLQVVIMGEICGELLQKLHKRVLRYIIRLCCVAHCLVTHPLFVSHI